MVTSPGWMIYPRDNGFFDSWLLDPSYLGSLSLALDQAADTVEDDCGEGDEGPHQGEKQGDKGWKNTTLIPGQILPHGELVG